MRERIKDISPITTFFVKLFSDKTNKPTLQVAPDFLQKLEAYHWPGNVRELKNIIERSVILVKECILTCDILPFDMQQVRDNTTKTLSAFSMQSVEKLQIQKVHNYSRGNKAETARLLEIGIATLYSRTEEYNL